jgi:hypothetical protein
MPAFSFPPSLPDLRSQLGAQVDFLTQVSQHAIDTARQLSELNVHAARQLLDDGFRAGRALANCKDPFQIGTVALREAQPAAEHWRSWQGALMGVLSAGGARFAHEARDGSWRAAPAVTTGAAEDVGAAHNPT